MGRGIDYGIGRLANGNLPNRDPDTGIRYGVISANAVDYWWEAAESQYECECEPDRDCMCDPVSHDVDEEGVKASCGESNDIFVFISPFFTRAAFCSPCAPGACYLTDPCEDGERAYCLGHEWFEGAAPYPVYRVDTGEEVPYVQG